jgi:DUF1365 family protein
MNRPTWNEPLRPGQRIPVSGRATGTPLTRGGRTVTGRQIAMVGSGVAGLTAAYVLSRGGDAVTLFEADGRLGGHADTHMVAGPGGHELAVDTGFIVHNRRTYPLLTRLFGELGVTTQPAEMSMSVRCRGCGLQYAGNRGPGGLLAGIPHGHGRYLRMLTEVRGFHRAARRLLDARGIDLAGGRVLMLSHARVLGYVFNPLTVYWCHGAAGLLECVVAEVHNTYRQRHCYLLRTDAKGRAETAKEFYVSSFFPVEGSYRMSLPEPGQRLTLSVVLHRPGQSPFAASVRGRRMRPGLPGLLAAAILHPWSTAAVAGRIRWQGIKLYALGLRPWPRPEHPPQEGAACGRQPAAEPASRHRTRTGQEDHQR